MPVFLTRARIEVFRNGEIEVLYEIAPEVFMELDDYVMLKRERGEAALKEAKKITSKEKIKAFLKEVLERKSAKSKAAKAAKIEAEAAAAAAKPTMSEAAAGGVAAAGGGAPAAKESLAKKIYKIPRSVRFAALQKSKLPLTKKQKQGGDLPKHDKRVFLEAIHENSKIYSMKELTSLFSFLDNKFYDIDILNELYPEVDPEPITKEEIEAKKSAADKGKSKKEAVAKALAEMAAKVEAQRADPAYQAAQAKLREKIRVEDEERSKAYAAELAETKRREAKNPLNVEGESETKKKYFASPEVRKRIRDALSWTVKRGKDGGLEIITFPRDEFIKKLKETEEPYFYVSYMRGSVGEYTPPTIQSLGQIKGMTEGATRLSGEMKTSIFYIKSDK